MIGFLLFLFVMGFVAWAISLTPIPAQFKQLIFGVMIFLAVLMLIQTIGIYDFGLDWRH